MGKGEKKQKIKISNGKNRKKQKRRKKLKSRKIRKEEKKLKKLFFSAIFFFSDFSAFRFFSYEETAEKQKVNIAER